MTHASLFSGIGGPEVAAAMMGWENAFHCEINPFGRAVLDYWFPESKSYEDITKTSFKEWRGRIDVLTGGFPCQPFSLAGKRGGAGDNRYLWPEMLRVIDEVRPTWVVGENVAGITTMVEGGVLTPLGCESSLFQEDDELHGYELEQSFTIERICKDLEGLGYSVQPLLIPAASVADPNGTGREESQFPGWEADSTEDGAGVHDRVERFGGNATPTDTDLQRFHECVHSTQSGEEERFDHEAGLNWGDTHGLYPECRWDSFPTVSPVHRGNDGIPFPLDNLTIPQTRWRFESLKAYGNSIVPQVMYRIFQSIEYAEQEWNNGNR